MKSQIFMPVSIIRTIALVASCAFAGMLMGGLFGYCSGRIVPNLYQRLIPWKRLEPIVAASFLGAFDGVLAGGGFGVERIIAQLVSVWLDQKHRPS